MMDAANPMAIIARQERLLADRATFEQHWEQVREVAYPTAKSFTSTGVAGEKLHQKVYDGTVEQNLEMEAAGLQALLTNPATIWFLLRTLDNKLMRVPAVTQWLQQIQQILYAMFNSPRSGFVSASHERYLDLVAFGTGVTLIEERPGNVPLFQTRPLAENCLAENAEGRVDTNYRTLRYTAGQAWRRWGPAAGEKVAKAAQDPKTVDNQFTFVHAVQPRNARDAQKRDARNMAWASVWVNKDEKRTVAESGYQEFPYVAPRWTKRAGETYGRGPGMKVLADARMLQRAMKETITGVELVNRPPLLVADDGVLGPVRLTGGGLTTVRSDLLSGSGSPIRPLTTGARPDIGEDFMKGVRERIGKGTLADLFHFARDPSMTLGQYLGITEQVMQQLNPVLGRMQAEDLGPTIDRVFAIGLRSPGVFPPPPAELEDGAELRVDYVSPVARKQRVGEARALFDWLDGNAALRQAHPELDDVLDGDKAMRWSADLLGVPADLMRPEEIVAQMRQAKQQQAAGAQQVQQLEQLAGAGAKGAKAMALLNPQPAQAAA